MIASLKVGTLEKYKPFKPIDKRLTGLVITVKHKYVVCFWPFPIRLYLDCHENKVFSNISSFHFMYTYTLAKFSHFKVFKVTEVICLVVYTIYPMLKI